MKRAVFLDRDGVLNRNIWNPATKAYESPLTPEQLELLPGVIPALHLLSGAGYLLFLVSNQPNYAKGKSAMSTLEAIHSKLDRLLTAANVLFTAYYYCFHHPVFTGKCVCRKPSPYFLFQARDCFDVDLAHSWMVGDRATDIQCGRAAGTRTVEIIDAPVSSAGADWVAVDLWSAAQMMIVTDQTESAGTSFLAAI